MANLLTILRVLLSIVAVEYIFSGRPDLCISALFISIFGIILDGLDGVAARTFHEESKLGSVYDILCRIKRIMCCLEKRIVFISYSLFVYSFENPGTRRSKQEDSCRIFGSDCFLFRRIFSKRLYKPKRL